MFEGALDHEYFRVHDRAFAEGRAEGRAEGVIILARADNKGDEAICGALTNVLGMSREEARASIAAYDVSRGGDKEQACLPSRHG